jgi:hypothetical protein
MGPRICANFKSVCLLSFSEEQEEEATGPTTPLAQGSSCWPRRRSCVLHSLEGFF